MNTPHYVYRAFDSYGLLLYIGCSKDVRKRMAQHQSQSMWHRYAETIAIIGPYPRDEALRRETAAIESEASYFNATKADMRRSQTNQRTANRQAAERLGPYPEIDFDLLDDDAYCAEWDRLTSLWWAEQERAKARLKATTHPYLTDDDRLQRYLAARQDAALAMHEAGAA